MIRAKVDALKWAAARMAPKTYGDKTEVEHRGGLTLEQLVIDATAKRQGSDEAAAEI